MPDKIEIIRLERQKKVLEKLIGRQQRMRATKLGRLMASRNLIDREDWKQNVDASIKGFYRGEGSMINDAIKGYQQQIDEIERQLNILRGREQARKNRKRRR